MCALFSFSLFSLALVLCYFGSFPSFFGSVGKIYWAARVYNVKMGAKSRPTVDFILCCYSFWCAHTPLRYIRNLVRFSHNKIYKYNQTHRHSANEYIRSFGLAIRDAQNPKNEHIFTGIFSLGLNYSSVVQQLRVHCTYTVITTALFESASLLAQNVKCALLLKQWFMLSVLLLGVLIVNSLTLLLARSLAMRNVIVKRRIVWLRVNYTMQWV